MSQQVQRSSILSNSRYGSEDDLHIQKAIQALRFKTQELLAKPREDIARLEEDIELKQIRIAEIDEEIRKIEEDKKNNESLVSVNRVESSNLRGRARRRWSLTGFGGMGADRDSESNDTEIQKRRAYSVDDEDVTDDELEPKGLPRRTKRLALMASKLKPPSLFRKPNQFKSMVNQSSGTSFDEDNSLLLKIKEVQEENRRLIEKQENNLQFKEEQVMALRLAYEEQLNIIKSLEDEIIQARSHKEQHENQSPIEEGTEDLQEMLLNLSAKQNALSSQIRLIKRIQSLDPATRKSAMSALRKDVVESAISLKSVKRMFEVNQGILLEDIAQSERDWATLCVKLHLMQLVSQKQLSRLEKNAARTELEEAVPSMERAAHALNEEIELREGGDESARRAIALETTHLEQLVNAILDCCKSYVDGVHEITSKEIPLPVGVMISDMMGQIEDGVIRTENVISLALALAEDEANNYLSDDQLLPDYLQEELLAPCDVAPSGDDENDGMNLSMLSVEEAEMIRLEDENDMLDLKLRQAEEIVKTKRAKSDGLKSTQFRLPDLISEYKIACQEWKVMDDKFENALKEAEDSKIAEDALRAFLERTSRPRLLQFAESKKTLKD
jgi:hypothetical protein